MHRLKNLKDKFKGETCIIMGNGPSLEDFLTIEEDVPGDLTRFGANMIIEHYNPDYLTCVDELMLHDFIPGVKKHGGGWGLTFVREGYPLPGSAQLNVQIAPVFSFNPTEMVIIGGTVTYVNLQLAYWMGFETALLVGMDHHYPGAGTGGKPGSKFIQDGPDQDHYSTDYFKDGRIYARPELDAVAKYTFPMAQRAWVEDGRRIINCSTFTKLEVFPTGDIGDYL